MSMRGCILAEIAKVKARSYNQLTNQLTEKIPSDSWVVGYLDSGPLSPYSSYDQTLFRTSRNTSML